MKSVVDVDRFSFFLCYFQCVLHPLDVDHFSNITTLDGFRVSGFDVPEAMFQFGSSRQIASQQTVAQILPQTWRIGSMFPAFQRLKNKVREYFWVGLGGSKLLACLISWTGLGLLHHGPGALTPSWTGQHVCQLPSGIRLEPRGMHSAASDAFPIVYLQRHAILPRGRPHPLHYAGRSHNLFMPLQPTTATTIREQPRPVPRGHQPKNW